MGLGFPCLGPSNQDLKGTKDNLQRAAPQNVFVSPFFKEEEERAKCAQSSTFLGLNTPFARLSSGEFWDLTGGK